MEASGLILNIAKEKQNSKQSQNPKPSSSPITYLPLEWNMSNLGIRSQSTMELAIASIRQKELLESVVKATFPGYREAFAASFEGILFRPI